MLHVYMRVTLFVVRSLSIYELHGLVHVGRVGRSGSHCDGVFQVEAEHAQRCALCLLAGELERIAVPYHYRALELELAANVKVHLRSITGERFSTTTCFRGGDGQGWCDGSGQTLPPTFRRVTVSPSVSMKFTSPGLGAKAMANGLDSSGKLGPPAAERLNGLMKPPAAAGGLA